MRTISHITNGGWLICILAACSSTSVSHSDWDRDHDQQINRRKFVDAYLSQTLFERWSGGGSISYNGLFNEAFSSLDTDRDEKLSWPNSILKSNAFTLACSAAALTTGMTDANAGVNKKRNLASTQPVAILARYGILIATSE